MLQPLLPGGALGPGLPLLYLLTVSAGAVLISNRITATAVAALATFAVLSDRAYQLQQGVIDANDMLSAGLLSALIFLISLLLQRIVGRMAKIEEYEDEEYEEDGFEEANAVNEE